ncbi:hypothetical protein BC939DRAFT_447246 [Gamsiella multidivaricata]|uniref:uncharacterized protein n=1 Tax=Gamsiella multidivaricata TaxID=101098 RepID=UPI00221E6021|nr:uncharacterized protein BC939DRAFT_447246 [Gamsiella multidivaricata]KAI7826204.1 hypothetical protein BC939DRAFT_447246 [Gamsiella multidivaricata]
MDTPVCCCSVRKPLMKSAFKANEITLRYFFLVDVSAAEAIDGVAVFDLAAGCFLAGCLVSFYTAVVVVVVVNAPAVVGDFTLALVVVTMTSVAVEDFVLASEEDLDVDVEMGMGDGRKTGTG